MALQASLEAASQASAPSAVADMPGRAESGSTSSGDVAPEPEQVAAEARARLPPEPAAGCRVGETGGGDGVLYFSCGRYAHFVCQGVWRVCLDACTHLRTQMCF